MLDKRILLLDLGGVLIDIDYTKTIAAFKELGIANFNDLYSQANQSGLFDAYETGQVSSFHFVNRLLDLMPRGCNPNQVVHAWNAMILGFPPERLTLLEKLSAHYDLYLLSNTNDLHMEKVHRALAKVTDKKLGTYFQNMFLSQEIGKRKPEVSTFTYVLDQIGAKPQEVLFLDDSLQHVQGAQLAGIDAVHLTDELLNYPFFS